MVAPMVLQLKLWESRSSPILIDPLMGWTSSDDTQTQVCLQFDTKDAAVDYAERHGIQATIVERKSGQQIYVLAVMGRISQQIVVVSGPIRLPSYHVKEAASVALVPDLKT